MSDVIIKSGKAYALSQIFDGSKRIIIPDLQRDYCWGDTNNLAENFCTSLLTLFTEWKKSANTQLSLGLIYAYENPRGFVNIADGQQRITSIYLLIWVIWHKTQDNILLDFLSLDKGKSQKEPRLRYEVRESTIYFLKDLLNHNDLDIKKAAWFRDEYQNDPSVNSMCEAIDIFNKKLDIFNKELPNEDPRVREFAYFLLGINPPGTSVDILLKERMANMDKPESISRLFAGFSGISFVYFDVHDRQFGEQMYVIINTRGAPMEPNEHIKPLLIGKLENQSQWTEKWESWQDFFWQHKKNDESSADEGFNDFIRWYLQATAKKNVAQKDIVTKSKILEEIADRLKDEPPMRILEDLEQYFEKLKILWQDSTENEKFKIIFKQIQPGFINLRDLTEDQVKLILLPLFKYMVKTNSKNPYKLLRLLRRNYFDIQYRPKQSSLKWPAIINNIDDIEKSLDDNDYNSKIAGLESGVVEDLEDHEMFRGRIDLLIDCMGEPRSTDSLKKYWGILEKLLEDKIKLLQLLLACGWWADAYSNGPSRFSLLPDNEFCRLTVDEQGQGRKTIIEILQEIHNKNPNVADYIDSKCSSFLKEAEADWRYPLVKVGGDKLLVYSELKFIDIDRAHNRVYLLKKQTYNSCELLFDKKLSFLNKLAELKNFDVYTYNEKKELIPRPQELTPRSKALGGVGFAWWYSLIYDKEMKLGICTDNDSHSMRIYWGQLKDDIQQSFTPGKEFESAPPNSCQFDKNLEVDKFWDNISLSLK